MSDYWICPLLIFLAYIKRGDHFGGDSKKMGPMGGFFWGKRMKKINIKKPGFDPVPCQFLLCLFFHFDASVMLDIQK